MADLGVYNVGYFLGTLPLLISQALNNKVIFPLYRHRPMSEDPQNRAKVFRARRMVIGFCLAMTMVLAYIGIWLIELLYDPRYSMAGPVVVLFSLSLVPRLVNTGSGAVLLAAGDSRNFFFLNATTATVQTLLMFALVPHFGILAVIAAPAIATILVNPLRIHFTRKHQGWDWRGDVVFFILGVTINGLACWIHWEDLVRLMG
jgi:O-antigen/teichoic acid export membrane protein